MSWHKRWQNTLPYHTRPHKVTQCFNANLISWVVKFTFIYFPFSWWTNIKAFTSLHLLSNKKRENKTSLEFWDHHSIDKMAIRFFFNLSDEWMAIQISILFSFVWLNQQLITYRKVTQKCRCHTLIKAIIWTSRSF